MLDRIHTHDRPWHVSILWGLGIGITVIDIPAWLGCSVWWFIPSIFVSFLIAAAVAYRYTTLDIRNGKLK